MSARVGVFLCVVSVSVSVSMLGCGPGAPEPSGSTGGSTGGSTSPADSTGAGSTNDADGGTSGATPVDVDGSESDSTEAGSTEAGPGEEVVEVVGQWDCSGYGDPVLMQVDALRVEPSSVDGLGCGVSATVKQSPFEGDNCSPLALLDGEETVRVGFTLPYPGFDDFGPIDLEFRGEYDAGLDRLVGQLWNSELDQTNKSECARVEF